MDKSKYNWFSNGKLHAILLLSVADEILIISSSSVDIALLMYQCEPGLRYSTINDENKYESKDHLFIYFQNNNNGK